MFTERHVVACFLTSRGRILLLKRSNQVGTYQGRWAGVSGSVKDEPLAQAIREIHEETGLLPQDLRLVRRGPPLEVVDRGRQMRWQVYPFLFQVGEPDAIRLSWEHVEYRWVDPRQLDQYHTVPMLSEQLARVWDPGELGPVTGAIRSPELEPQRDPAAGLPPGEVPFSGLQPAQAQYLEPRSVAPRPPGSASIPVSVRPALPSDLAGQHDDPDPEEDELEDELLETDEAEEPPARPAGIRVKILRTGEYPLPEMPGLMLGREPLPPACTGPALLEDPLLSAALDGIRDETLHNSTLLAARALDALHLAGERSAAATMDEWLEDLGRVGRTLAGLRPSLAAIGHQVAQALYEMGVARDRAGNLELLRPVLGRHVTRLQEQERSAGDLLADEVARLIPPGGTILTLSYTPAVVEGLNRCRHFGIRVIIPEGRPTNDGRLAARALLGMGKSVTVIVDAAVGLHAREADLVLLGAEALLADGSMVHRTGSYPLALAAKAARVPLYVAAPMNRLELSPDATSHLALEEKGPAEVWEEELPGLEVRNVYYERVPPELITGILTEDGLIEPSGLDWEVKARSHLLEALTGVSAAGT